MSELPLNLHKWFENLANSIVALYDGEFKDKGTAILDKNLDELLIINFKLWKYEDEARRNDLPDKDIANIKRHIDKENQNRHNLIDSLDAALKEEIEKKIESIDKALPLNSETPASIFDRLIVLALRIHNLKIETERKNADKSHIEKCSRMLKEVKERSEDLLKCLEELLVDYYSGRKRLKSYKQYKLYNDPDLNPSLHNKTK